MATYAGNQFGDRRLYVFDRTSGTGGTQANFIKTVPFISTMVGATTTYFNAGGLSYGTTAELLPFIGNKVYENYARREQRTLTSLSHDSAGGITSTIVNFTPDPRSHIAIQITGSTSFTGEHMDEIFITAKNGITYQGFLGRIIYGDDNPLVGTTGGIVELVAYGTSGGAAVLANAYEMNVGNTIQNKINGVVGHIARDDFSQLVDIDSHREAISGQAVASLQTNSLTGCTIGTRGGNAGGGQSIFWQQHSLSVVNFVSRLLPAFAHGASGVSASDATKGPGTYRVPEIFTMYAGVTGDLGEVNSEGTGAIWGATLNGITGGTLGGSEFEEFAHAVIHLHAGALNKAEGLNKQFRDVNTIREIDEISF